jgi:hypothetical protein
MPILIGLMSKDSMKQENAMRPAVLKHLENSFIYQKPILIGLMSKESSETGKCHEARCFKQLAISFIYQKPILAKQAKCR